MYKIGGLSVLLLLCCCHNILADNLLSNVIGGAIPTTDIPLGTDFGPTSEASSTLLWILITGFILAFILSFGVGANDVANVFGTCVGAKVVSLKQACCIATVAEILGAVLLELLPFVIAGFILAFVLAFGVGANDVANSFGTSVGSGVLTLRKACILATIFETLGAILIGYKVSDTVRKGILDVSLYNNTEKELMLGSLAALGGSSLWNLLATFLKLPISGTHTIVGATVGFSLCARGAQGVNWLTFGKIVASWFVSPVLSGLMSGAIFIGVRRWVLNKDKPLEPGLRSLPFFYGFTILVNIFSIVHDGPEMLRLNNLPLWISLTTSVAAGILVGSFVQFIVVPRQRRQITEGLRNNQYVQFTIGSADNSRSPTPPGDLTQLEKGITPANPTSYPLLSVNSNGYLPVTDKNNDVIFDTDIVEKENFKNLKLDHIELPDKSSQIPLVPTSGSTISKGSVDKRDEGDSYEVGKLFSFLQILTATFGSFAHGGNDVSNAIGPLIALWAIYTDGSVAQKSEPPIYILLYGGLGISLGLWIWGRRVIQTIGEDLTKVTPSSGFTIEIGSAFTVLLASKIGLPISTTHCKVGSVVFVGWCKSTKDGVDWSLFRNIVIAWVVTVPLTASVSAFLMWIFRLLFL